MTTEIGFGALNSVAIAAAYVTGLLEPFTVWG
jgi:hypothetical protein